MQAQESMQGRESAHGMPQDQQSGSSEPHMNPERADSERFDDEPSQRRDREQVSATGQSDEESQEHSDLAARPREEGRP